MRIALPFLFGLCASVAGVIPPGLLNMTAVRIGLKEGRTRAFVFSLGATFVLAFQVYAALAFARFLDRNPQIILMLREAGLFIFACLTVYFLFIAKPAFPEKKELEFQSKRSRFFMGMLLSALNFFPIPFYVFVSLTMASYKVFRFEEPLLSVFTFSVMCGNLFGFYCFTTFFRRMEHKMGFVIRNMNYVIGSATGIVAIATAINVLQYYYG